jgi:hypothetical protein
MLLVELETITIEVTQQWPKPLGETVKQEETTEAHWHLTRKRDLLSDSVKIFTAMSVEAFLNFYGVLRLGPSGFDLKFERLGPVPKLKKLFKRCDSVVLDDMNPIVQTLDWITLGNGAMDGHLRERLVAQVRAYMPGAC